MHIKWVFHCSVFKVLKVSFKYWNSDFTSILKILNIFIEYQYIWYWNTVTEISKSCRKYNYCMSHSVFVEVTMYFLGSLRSLVIFCFYTFLYLKKHDVLRIKEIYFCPPYSIFFVISQDVTNTLKTWTLKERHWKYKFLQVVSTKVTHTYGSLVTFVVEVANYCSVGCSFKTVLDSVGCVSCCAKVYRNYSFIHVFLKISVWA